MPFDMSYIYETGNAAADMLVKGTAAATGRVLQWLTVVEERDGLDASLPISNSSPQSEEASEHSGWALNTSLDKPLPKSRWSEGPSLDDKVWFTAKEIPALLGHARPVSGGSEQAYTGSAKTLIALCPGRDARTMSIRRVWCAIFCLPKNELSPQQQELIPYQSKSER